MTSKNIFANETVKIRLIKLDYKYKNRFNETNKNKLEKAKQDFEADMRRIYKEETNKELPKDMKIYTSKELLKNKDASIKNSGYDGTAIYIKDKKHDTDQLQIISQGSQEDRDWEYNFFGLFIGVDDSEYKAGRDFTIEAKKRAGNTKDMKTYAMGHSLANNNQIMQKLINREFEDVYGINGAQISVDHLWKADKKLKKYLIRKFNIRNIDSIPPEKLKKSIIKYYKDKGVTANITQRISKDDPLYGVSGKADFITFGHVNMTDTNPDTKGLRTVIDHIPDEDIRSLKRYFQQYSADYQKGGLNGFVKAAIGADTDTFKGLQQGGLSYFISHMDEVGHLETTLMKRLPKLKKFFKKINDYSGPVLDQLEANGYIDSTKKQTLKTDFDQINQHIEKMEGLLEDIANSQEFTKYNPDGNTLGYVLAKYLEIYRTYLELQKSLDKLNKHSKDLIKLIGEGHNLTPMLNALARKGFSYQGEDMYYSKKGQDGKEIEVNLSSALRIYREGLKAVSEVENQIDNYCRIIQHEFDHDFDQKKRDLKTEIHRMEATPILAKLNLQVLLQSGFSHIGDNIEKVEVHDSFETAPLPQFDGIVKELKNIASEKKEFVEDVRSSIEKLLDHDKMISAMFNYQPQEAG
ncbi:hypothetical protein PJ311_01415 [Bacillus sp. CLL-7-23]|uniref:DUF6792 domain-containing protein n=1 Tax=Bacillus changyiensis TaxID=3004103 RepID=A0ABT4WZ08_9BACI|nr:DUF6792 domain-containing protein [Bacillus changyiensis]MDA7025264.1 hypothetical protein [Bacillus changyiensis]